MADILTPLDVDMLRSHLIGFPSLWRRIDVVDTTGSTNVDLLTQAVQGINIDHHVLLAEYQTHGRGRCGRYWRSVPYSQLNLSVGISLDSVQSEYWGWLSLATGVAIMDTLTKTLGFPSENIALKWPNDIVVGTHKLAGILVDIVPGTLLAIVGIGINVVTVADEQFNSAALDIFGFDQQQRTMLAIEVLTTLAKRIKDWKMVHGRDEMLMADYRRYSCTVGQEVIVTLPGDRYLRGHATNIDQWGQLCLHTSTDSVAISAGDVTLLRPVNR